MEKLGIAIILTASWIDKQARRPVFSWIAHAVFALPIALGGVGLYAFLVWTGVDARSALATSVTAVAFGAREVEQFVFARIARVPFTEGELLDRAMDVLVPAVAMGLVF